MQREPRQILDEHYETRKAWDRPVGKPFKDSIEREDDLKVEYKLYQEKKLEQ